MSYILVLYCSRYGAVRKMAEVIAEGIEQVSTELEARIRTVPAVQPVTGSSTPTLEEAQHVEVTVEDLNDCAGLALGSPTRFGNMAAPMKYFLDTTAAQWINGDLIDKPACVFTSSSSLHGGQETTLVSMMFPLIHQGMVILGIPYSEPALSSTTSGGTPYGASHVTYNDNDRELTDEERQLCLAQGKRLASLVGKLVAV